MTKPVALDSIICPLPSFKDVQRQIIDSYLVKELIDHSNSYNDYLDIENTIKIFAGDQDNVCLLYTSPSPRDRTRSRMPSSA